MEQVVNIDGKILPAAEATISVFDRGFLFGDSIYETLRTYKRIPFLMDRHLKRLQNSAAMLASELPVSLSEISKRVVTTVESSGNPECYIRIIVSRGTASKMGLDTSFSKSPRIVIIVVPLEPPSSEYYKRGVKLSLVSVRRNDVTTLNPKIKSSNLLNNVLAYVEAKKSGSFEGILCNIAGKVAEGTGSNVFIVKHGALRTPPPEAGLLEGVTRALVLDLARSEKIPCEEVQFDPVDLLDADECFITSTTKEILPVRQIDDRPLQDVPGKITGQLMKAYRSFVNGQMENKSY